MTQALGVSGGGPVNEGSVVTLTATLSPATPAATSWKWEKKRDAGTWTAVGIESTYSFKASEDTKGTYRASAATPHGDIDPTEVEVSLKPANADTPEPAPSESPAVWHERFAIFAAVIGVGLVVLFVFGTDFFEKDLGLDETAYEKLDGRAIVGSRVIGPIAIVGMIVVTVGLWMTVVEWRGRFKEQKVETVGARGGGEDAVKLIEALGKLKGATLVLITGAVIFLSVAWMTSSTTGSTPSSPTTTSQP